jgi:hypothetical protein
MYFTEINVAILKSRNADKTCDTWNWVRGKIIRGNVS